MSVLKNFKTTPGPPWGRQALNVIFFLQICNEVPDRGRAGEGGPVAPPRATTGPSPRARQGSCRPPSPPAGDRGNPLYKIQPPIPSSFEPENSTKNPEKKRGVRRRKAAKPCRIQHL